MSVVGPLFLSGDCRASGVCFRPPFLLILSLIAIGSSLIDLYLKFVGTTPRTALDFVWLAAVCACNVAPFFAGRELLETRRTFLHSSLRPLLASRAFGYGGVKIRLIGEPSDQVYLSKSHTHTTRTFRHTI